MLLFAPAKVNLTLAVFGKRPDEYHQLESLMVPVSLADEVEIRLEPEGKELIEVACPGRPGLDGPDNLAFKAAEGFRKSVRGWKGALSVTVRKEIPAASGLAGGTADAAAVIRGLCALCDVRQDSEAVRRLCEALGSDLPFCFSGRPAWVRGRGEVIRPCEGFSGIDLCLVCPEASVSSGWAYGQLDAPSLTWEEVKALTMRPVPVTGREGLLAKVTTMRNDLFAVVSKRYPELGDLGRALSGAGALLWSMSGSGPCMFGIFSSEAAALEAAGTFSARGMWAWACRSLSGWPVPGPVRPTGPGAKNP